MPVSSLLVMYFCPMSKHDFLLIMVQIFIEAHNNISSLLLSSNFEIYPPSPSIMSHVPGNMNDGWKNCLSNPGEWEVHSDDWEWGSTSLHCQTKPLLLGNIHSDFSVLNQTNWNSSNSQDKSLDHLPTQEWAKVQYHWCTEQAKVLDAGDPTFISGPVLEHLSEVKSEGCLCLKQVRNEEKKIENLRKEMRELKNHILAHQKT
ncbi:hypothetical protein GYMLUDRAFT_58395 [Collybiopsis luxurians FD-317 M1]|uniref:Uncharacterized protein n=1 Tax=Collybiopsis luxurians FD-317 M1 TaxID=944289 RepID=A0A0D0BEH0_9AGAR|nr:hypothetical protein GYMLUDRAFT_58395 [Collybiopsis luxurians FD-317 M1]